MTINEFLKKLESISTIKQAESLLGEYLRGFGFSCFAVTLYVGHTKTGQKLRYDFAAPPLRIWHEYYLQQGYADVDRTLENVSSISLPHHWCVHAQLAAAKNIREARMREESLDYGIVKGISLPVHGMNQDILMLTLHQRKDENCLQDAERYQFEWLAAALVYYHHLKRLLDLNSRREHKAKLTKREEQCLLLTAQSCRVEQIAKELKISERTVNFHLQNANKKIGTNNKYQSINKYFNSK